MSALKTRWCTVCVPARMLTFSHDERKPYYEKENYNDKHTRRDTFGMYY
jgi:hypothetical protein